MIKLKFAFEKLKDVFRRKPKLIIPATILSFLVIFCLVELTRAGLYQSRVEDFKNSSAVQSLHETVDKIQRTAELNPQSYFCAINLDGLLSGFNRAYSETESQQNEIETLLQQLRNKIDASSSSPSYSSAVDFLPPASESRQISDEMARAFKTMSSLTEKDTRTSYCMEIEQVLTRMYFLKSLAKAEGVAAMMPGQVENFQVNLRQAEERLHEIKTVPKVFASEHEDLSNALQKIGENLRRNTNKYEAFSRRIEKNVESLESITSSISDKTEDLQHRPQAIALQASYL